MESPWIKLSEIYLLLGAVNLRPEDVQTISISSIRISGSADGLLPFLPCVFVITKLAIKA